MRHFTLAGILAVLACFPLVGAAEESTGVAAAETSAGETAAVSPPDFGDHSSATLTGKAWAALETGNHQHVLAYTAKCIELYGEKALEMQASLEAPAPAEKAHDYWALNDVGTCYYIRAMSHQAEGDDSKALADFKKLKASFSFAQTWDTKGWFWQPATVASQKIKIMEFNAL